MLTQSAILLLCSFSEIKKNMYVCRLFGKFSGFGKTATLWSTLLKWGIWCRIFKKHLAENAVLPDLRNTLVITVLYFPVQGLHCRSQHWHYFLIHLELR